jgi:hypothetical protein
VFGSAKAPNTGEFDGLNSTTGVCPANRNLMSDACVRRTPTFRDTVVLTAIVRGDAKRITSFSMENERTAIGGEYHPTSNIARSRRSKSPYTRQAWRSASVG